MRDKVIALVTGANKGLGKEVVRQLGTKGMRVYVGSRNQARGEAAFAELVSEGLDAQLMQLDVTSDESVTKAAEILAQREGHLDVLVNNAGTLVARPAFEIGRRYARDLRDQCVWRSAHDPRNAATSPASIAPAYRQHCQHDSFPDAGERPNHNVRT
jgi:NAD(P)-dependent dehydrogenase (short-subunit alcohol dehydrogenase family)